MASEFVVATADLYPPGSWACAHRKGDLVPRVNVKRNGWTDLVAEQEQAQETKGEGS